MQKCPYCRVPMKIVELRQYLPEQEIEGWVFWCKRCKRYFAAPTDDQVRLFTRESCHTTTTTTTTY